MGLWRFMGLHSFWLWLGVAMVDFGVAIACLGGWGGGQGRTEGEEVDGDKIF